MTEEDDLSEEDALKIIIPAEMIKDEGYGYPLQCENNEMEEDEEYEENEEIEQYGLNPLNLYKVKQI